MAVGMTRAEMRTLIAGLKLASAIASKDMSGPVKITDQLDSLVKRLVSLGNISLAEEEKIKDACDGIYNRFEDRLVKVLRDQVQREFDDAQDAQIKKTSHGGRVTLNSHGTRVTLDVDPGAIDPGLPAVVTPRQSARLPFVQKQRGDWSKEFDDFYEVVKTSLYVPNPNAHSMRGLNAEGKNDAFLGWVATQKEFAKFFTEDRYLVLGKGLRIWRERWGLPPITPRAGQAEIDRYFRTYLPNTPRKKRSQ